MALLQEWREYAYSEEMQNSKEGQKLWENYFTLEKGIYEKLLANPSEIVEGTVQELADRYEVPLSMMVGFLDGINDSLKEANPIDEMEKDTKVKLDIDLEKLYYNMVECKAEWLYTLPQWNDIPLHLSVYHRVPPLYIFPTRSQAHLLYTIPSSR